MESFEGRGKELVLDTEGHWKPVAGYRKESYGPSDERENFGRT